MLLRFDGSDATSNNCCFGDMISPKHVRVIPNRTRTVKTSIDEGDYPRIPVTSWTSINQDTAVVDMLDG